MYIWEKCTVGMGRYIHYVHFPQGPICHVTDFQVDQMIFSVFIVPYCIQVHHSSGVSHVVLPLFLTTNRFSPV